MNFYSTIKRKVTEARTKLIYLNLLLTTKNSARSLKDLLQLIQRQSQSYSTRPSCSVDIMY